MNREVCITTIDNPFDPFDDYNNWHLFDTEKGYYTHSKLARLCKTEEGMTEIEEKKAIEEAIDRLIEIDPLDIYKKLVRED